jgi:hypothetical protein
LLPYRTYKYYIFWMCVCGLSYQACNLHAPYFQLWRMWLYHIFPHCLINGMIFEKKIEHKMCFAFIDNFLLKRFSFQEEFIESLSYTYICLHWKYTLFSSDLNEIHKYQISWKSIGRELSCSMQTDGRTIGPAVRRDELNCRFSQFYERA